MNIIIPMAGYGTRLRPHTFTRPKPLINVAGKTVLGHVLDGLASVPNVEETIFITGYLGEQIEEYVSKHYPGLRASYYEQKVLDGQSSAVYLARQHLTGPLLIVFVDTLVETDLSGLAGEGADAVAWVKQVEDPRRFGAARLGAGGYVESLVEKPQDVRDNLVVVGFYYFKEARALAAAIAEQIARDIKLKGEYFLADAINLMLERGLKMRVQPVEV
ncbi:MAG: nucleotidyltransferase family protein, partial [Chloroflexi bacterium]|nr:nucleotidyltransferase family protein [Chloroflexota bacterium]